MTGIALYQLAGQYQQLAEKLAGMDLDAQTVADTIEASGLTDEISTKAQGIEMVARSAEMFFPAIDAEIERLQALKAHRQKIAQGLRDYLKSNMEAAGIEKIECPLFKIAIKKNPPAVEILDEQQIPQSFWVTPEPKPPVARPDKTAIKKAIQAGQEVAGAKLVQGTRLDIS
jgi:hypothetical protein